MPNWCSNEVTFVGSLDDLACFEEVFCKELPAKYNKQNSYSPTFDFTRLIPENPEHVRFDAYMTSLPDNIRSNLGTAGIHDSFNNLGGCDYNVQTYGTKWPAGEAYDVKVQVSHVTQVFLDSTEEPLIEQALVAKAEVSLDTAWAPFSENVFEKLVDVMQEPATLNNTYVEPGMCFAGTFTRTLFGGAIGLDSERFKVVGDKEFNDDERKAKWPHYFQYDED